jgi:hypothetical protein
MSIQLRKSYQVYRKRHAVILAFMLLVLPFMSAVTAFGQEEMMRGHRTGSAPPASSGQMERGGRRGIGIGDAIGIGVGVGGTILQQGSNPNEQGAKKRARKDKKPSKALPEEIKFVGKPEQILHNPKHRDGKLGNQRDHKQVVIAKADHYFKRHYYYTRGGERLTWYWYDDPIANTDPVIATLKSIPVCANDSDDCDEPQPLPPIYVDNPPTPSDNPAEKPDTTKSETLPDPVGTNPRESTEIDPLTGKKITKREWFDPDTKKPTETREYDEDGHVTYQETFHHNGKSAHYKVIDPAGKTVIEVYRNDESELTEIIEYWPGTTVVKTRKKFAEHERKKWITTYDENGNEENTTYTETDTVTRVKKIEVSDGKTHKVIIRKWINMDADDEAHEVIRTDYYDNTGKYRGTTNGTPKPGFTPDPPPIDLVQDKPDIPNPLPPINIGQPDHDDVARPNVPVANACPDCGAIRKLIAELDKKAAKDQETRDNFYKYHLYDTSLGEAYLKVLDEKLADDAIESKNLAARLFECAKKCPVPPVAVGPPPVINVDNPPRPPNTCSIVEGTGHEIGTSVIDCHGHKGKITVENDVTTNPIPSIPKLAIAAEAREKAIAEGKEPVDESTLYEPVPGHFSIKYTGTPCDDCRWFQFFWEEDLIKRREEDKFENIPADPPTDPFLSSPENKEWHVDAVSPKVQANFVAHGADPEVFKNPAYCIEKYSMGLREACEPGKDGTEQILDLPNPGTKSVFGRIGRHDYDDNFAYRNVVRIKYVMHFETYLVCGQEICAKVCWQARFEWDTSKPRLEGLPKNWEKNYDLEKDAECGKEGIQTGDNIHFNDGQKTALSTNYPNYVQPR